MRPRFRTYEGLLAQYIATVRTRSGINLPFHEGNVDRSTAEASALNDAMQYVEMARMARFQSLELLAGDELAERAAEEGVPQLQATRATVQGKFRRIPGTTGDITVNVGTPVFVPGTPTINPIEFTSGATVTILDGNPESAAVTATAVIAGDDANGIAPGTALPLKSTVVNVQDFITTTTSGGGNPVESDEKLIARVRATPQEAAAATKTAWESAVRKVSVAGQNSVRAILVIENFTTGVTQVYVDDGSGVSANIDPIVASQTYRYTAAGGELYVYAESLVGISVGQSKEGLPAGFPFRTITSVTKDDLPYGAPVTLILGSTYYASNHAGILAFPTPLVAGDRIDITMTTSGGLVEEAAKVIRGIPGNVSYPGVRGANEPFSVDPPTSSTTATVTGALTVSPGFDGAYARRLVGENILAYVNGRQIGEPVRYAKLIDIAMSVPGASNFTLSAPTADIFPSSQTGVVRATSGSINIG